MTRRSILFLATASPIFGKRWDEANFPAWNDEIIDDLMTDSPWARTWNGSVTIPLENKVLSSYAQIGGIGLPPPVSGIPWPGRSRTGIPRPGRGPVSDTGPVGVRTEISAVVRWASAL